ncbi:hypothetical protein BD310DRAFT_986943 [Dichomitus squalens]|uniref:Retrotransposon gag domain-containing protein n=1 Tax=Dichomitus squalens TaxID=114155 RepID=A0A4Q9Q5G1_9APHY|nr:hypothetical protein BD310DRAFT_986943 [Dichomitus squalens]
MARTVADMPMRGSHKAPRTFKEHAHRVKDFLDEYETLLKHNNVTDAAQSCKVIMRYCSHDVREILETLDQTDWDTMKSQIEKIFDAEKPDQRYQKKDLSEFTRKAKVKPMTSMTRVRNYQREFQKIAGWLKKKNHITVAATRRVDSGRRSATTS